MSVRWEMNSRPVNFKHPKAFELFYFETVSTSRNLGVRFSDYTSEMRGLICMDMSSWNSSLQAYGMRTCEIWVLFLQPLHSNVLLRRLAMQIRPHRLQTCTRYGSETSKSRSRRNCAAPCAIWQSRSISPKRRPPSRALPSIGCRTSICTGPRALEWILSSTMCFNLW